MPFGKMIEAVENANGTITAATREYIEPARPTTKYIDRPGVLKKFGWNDHAFDVAQKFAFPIASKRAVLDRITLVWSVDALDRWAATLTDDVRALKLAH